jgi:hypothetical protein
LIPKSTYYSKLNPERYRAYTAKSRLNPLYLEKQKARRKIREDSPEYKARLAEYKRKFNERRLSTWSKVIPSIVNCGCCGCRISFEPRPDMGIIHFDHRSGGTEAIDKTPRKWLKNHPPTIENIKIWESCDFGFLCIRCNQLLPTRNRVEFLKNALKYAEGITNAC